MIKLFGAAPTNSADMTTKAYADNLITALPTKFQTIIGDGTLTSFSVAHNRNSAAVTVQTFSSEASPPAMPTVTLPDANTVLITFSRAPLANSIQVVVVG